MQIINRYIKNKLRFIFNLAVGIHLKSQQQNGYKNLIVKVFSVVRREGWVALRNVFGSLIKNSGYKNWVANYVEFSEASMKNQIKRFSITPSIAIVMPVFNPKIEHLKEAIESIQSQIYINWELCIADDASTDSSIRPLLESYARTDNRIKLTFRSVNGHISAASNSALEQATADYVALMDNDDVLPVHALFYVVKAINENPDAGLVYSDEDKLSKAGERCNPYFKCDLNYELLLAQNMISHLGVIKRDLIAQVGGFREGFEGAQDYDLYLRVLEKIEIRQVVHIPRVLYHWRAAPGSTALNPDEKGYATTAARKAVEEHLMRTGREAAVMPAPDVPSLNRVRYALPNVLPLVSIIIPTRDRADLLDMCLTSLLSKTTYPRYEIIVVDNGSVEDDTRLFFERLPKDKVRIIRDDSPFNYSRLNNLAANAAMGELICLMNNDIEILTPDWVEEMASFAMQPDIGCVGARLWYPDGYLQHGGVITGIGGVAGHSHKRLRKGEVGYFSRAVVHQSLSAVTAACLMVRRSVWKELSGLDESFAVAFNDVDFCLRVRNQGYRNVWTPYAEMNHHESASRGQETTPEKQMRFMGEVQKMQERWGDRLINDPAYNPNLSLESEDFSLAWPPRV